MSVEKGWDDVWIAVKFQSNSDIAGSPRNSFRASLAEKILGGRALNVLGAFTGYQKLSNSECRSIIRRSQTMGDKIHGRKGNSPDLQLRSQNVS
jgi:hypothetical protein